MKKSTMSRKSKKSRKAKNLEELKQAYEKVRKKYSLPSFNEVNEEFFLETVQQIESELLIRHLRNLVERKVKSLLNTLENFSNPQRAPILIMSILNELTETDKKLFEQIYNQIGELEIKSWKFEASPYNEAAEAKFIKECIKKLKEISPKLEKFFERVRELQAKKIKK